MEEKIDNNYQPEESVPDFVEQEEEPVDFEIPHDDINFSVVSDEELTEQADYQAMIKHEEYYEKLSDTTKSKLAAHEYFIANPYKKDTLVPSFGYLNSMTGHITVLQGYKFDHIDDNQQIVLHREEKSINSETGKEETRDYVFSLSPAEYNSQIENSTKFVNAPKLTESVIQEYNKNAQLDENEQRFNNAANFHHNYKAFCRKASNNPKEAIEFAKELISNMRESEREKIKKEIALYEKNSGKSFLQKLDEDYNKNVSDLQIKNKTPFNKSTLDSIKNNSSVVDSIGNKLDKSCKMTVGQSIKVQFSIKDCINNKKIKIEVKELVLVSHSKDNNAVCLIDKNGLSKYVIPRDEFIKNVQKIENRISKSKSKDYSLSMDL